MSKSSIGTEPVYDARTLGKPRMFILGLQHMFAMFGATVLVPALSGLDVATTLLFAGIGTLLFHLLTKGKVPAFLGSSFAFIGGYNAVRTIGTNADGFAIYNNDLLAYACFGVAIAGLMYIILSTLFKIFGVKKVMRYFPPIVTGPIIIAIGLTLSSSAITNCRANWLVAVVAILIVIGFNMWGKGMAKIIPILLGVLGSYIFALIVDPAERASVAAAVSSAKWFGLPIFWKNSVFHLFAGPVDSGVLWSAVLTVVPLSLATMVEHIGDICAISSTCGKNFMVDPGFHRTLLGDGLATTLASLFGAPANTTYGENTGVLALSRVYDPRVIRIAACIAIVVSFCPKFAALVSAMPTATIGGVSLVLYGMISAVGVRNVVENKVDFTNTRNVIIAALILVLAIGITYSGSIQIGVVSLSGLAVSSIVGILLEHAEDYAVIDSSNRSIMQHEPMSWNVEGPRFVHLGQRSPMGKVSDDLLRQWIGSMTPQEREQFTDALFDILSMSGKTRTLEDLRAGGLAKMAALLKQYNGADEKDKKIITEIFRRLASDVKGEMKKAAGEGLKTAEKGLSGVKNVITGLTKGDKSEK